MLDFVHIGDKSAILECKCMLPFLNKSQQIRLAENKLPHPQSNYSSENDLHIQ